MKERESLFIIKSLLGTMALGFTLTIKPTRDSRLMIRETEKCASC
jgi:hypothetical protein